MNRSLSADEILKQAQPVTDQHSFEIQPFGHLVRMPIALDENVCRESVENLNQVLADTLTLRDMYKKHHWQVAGPTFYQLHLLFDKHHKEQSELADTIAERIQILGGVSVAMAPDIAERTLIRARPRGGRRRRCKSRGCSTPTKSSSARRAPWHASPPRKATTERMMCW